MPSDDLMDTTELESALSQALGDDTATPPEPVEQAAEPEAPTVSADLGDAYNALEQDRQAAEAGVAGDVKWQRELRQMADRALAGAGLDPAKRHEAGLSRRETVRRLFAAEQLVRQDPAGGLAWLASQYAKGLDAGGRASAAQQMLSTLGFEAPGALSQTERARLQHFEQRAAAQRVEAQQGHHWAVGQVNAFAQKAPHFEAVRPLMGALIQSGQAATLEQAYEQAVSIRGLETDAARKAAEERRAAVAKAKNAGTPKTASVQAPPPDLSNMKLQDLLEHQFAELSD